MEIKEWVASKVVQAAIGPVMTAREDDPRWIEVLEKFHMALRLRLLIEFGHICMSHDQTNGEDVLDFSIQFQGLQISVRASSRLALSQHQSIPDHLPPQPARSGQR